MKSRPYPYDSLDAYIIKMLSEDPSIRYDVIANAYGCSPGNISVRINKLRKFGVIKRTKLELVPQAIGYELLCFIGITLTTAKAYNSVIKQLEAIPQIIEAYYTTGQYNIFVKILAQNIQSLHTILTEQIQTIPEIVSTDTIVSMDNPISRSLELYDHMVEEEGDKPHRRRLREEFDEEEEDGDELEDHLEEVVEPAPKRRTRRTQEVKEKTNFTVRSGKVPELKHQALDAFDNDIDVEAAEVAKSASKKSSSKTAAPTEEPRKRGRPRRHADLEEIEITTPRGVTKKVKPTIISLPRNRN